MTLKELISAASKEDTKEESPLMAHPLPHITKAQLRTYGRKRATARAVLRRIERGWRYLRGDRSEAMRDVTEERAVRARQDIEQCDAAIARPRREAA
jgi:hypothetical protein